MATRFHKKTKALQRSAGSPIGVFDSGLGGLTVVRELRRLLPSEEILYLGDLAHLPYGTKSTGEIRRRSAECARFLMKKKIKALVIACNSASSVAHKDLARILPVPVLDVITPAVEEALATTRNQRVGVIATYATIESRSYAKALEARSPEAQYFLKPCPLFVPLAEEGWLDGKIAEGAAEKYLAPIRRKQIDTLILGCTHYPLLKSAIAKVMGPKVRLVDSAIPTALRLKTLLQKKGLLSPRPRRAPLKIFVTDYVRNFARIGESFLGEKLKTVKLVKVP
ncbi:MAG TPA: glutamate racemase [Candidatus Omnitrophota bacterium]|nr:glutamate racemase [Candidatus Omnitrophota bacterium]HRY86079.1 glutamate racemase [Candidatus Omnitrophota bacterium]